MSIYRLGFVGLSAALFGILLCGQAPVNAADPRPRGGLADGMLPEGPDLSPVVLLAQVDYSHAVTPVGIAAPSDAPVADVGAPPALVADTESLDDQKILELMHVANAGEIAQAKLAKERAVDPEVRKLARMIALDHARAQRRATRLADEENVTPVESATSSKLQADGESTMIALEAKTSTAFDRAYVDAQVSEHDSFLRLIDTRLLPNAQAPTMKTLVSSMRPSIARHLAQAKLLQKRLGPVELARRIPGQ